MTTNEAVDAVRAGKAVRMVVGEGSEDPVLIVWRDEFSGVMSAAVAGWSQGVVEPVCGIDSKFLASYFDGKTLSIEEAGAPAWA